MRIFIPSLFALLLATSVQAGPVRTPTSGDATIQISKALHMFVAPPVRSTKELQHLIKAIRVIQGRGTRMTARRRHRIAAAALAASKATGVDAVLLLAVARMESDFRGIQGINWQCRDKRYRTCGADCGITQHYISGPRAWVIRRCRQLANNYKLVFLKSAKELAHHIHYCQKRQRRNKPLRRCVLNRYNSGTFYRTPRRCQKRWVRCIGMRPSRTWVFASVPAAERQHRHGIYADSLKRCRRVRHQCLRRAAYWKHVLCFKYAARRGIRPKHSCRHRRSLHDLSL